MRTSQEANQSWSKYQTAKDATFNNGNPSQQELAQQVLQMLGEIKNQNQFLTERNSELEFKVEKIMKHKIQNGFRQVNTEIQSLKKQNKQLIQMLAKKKVSQKSYFSSYKKFSYKNTESKNQEVEEELKMETVRQENQIVDIDRLGDQEPGESTFIRKLDSTKKVDETQIDNLGVSVGAKLLQMLGHSQQNQSQQKVTSDKKNKKIVKNFNFRCNLEEIDKIIEDENDNEENEAIVVKSKMEVSQTRQKQVKKVQRKEWGHFNPRKSIGKKRNNSKEIRPRAGLRINRVPKKEEADPILELLQSEKFENQEEMKEFQEQNFEEQIISNEEMKQNEVFNDLKKQKVQVENILKIDKNSNQSKKVNKGRGMFKAPEPNLIEQLLMNDDEQENEINLQDVNNQKQDIQIQNQKANEQKDSKNVNFRQNRFVSNNSKNILDILNQKSQSRSKSKKRSQQDMNIDEDEEVLDDENPFDMRNTLLKKEQSDDTQQSKTNLFFQSNQNQDKNQQRKGTAKFGEGQNR